MCAGVVWLKNNFQKDKKGPKKKRSATTTSRPRQTPKHGLPQMQRVNTMAE